MAKWSNDGKLISEKNDKNIFSNKKKTTTQSGSSSSSSPSKRKKNKRKFGDGLLNIVGAESDGGLFSKWKQKRYEKKLQREEDEDGEWVNTDNDGMSLYSMAANNYMEKLLAIQGDLEAYQYDIYGDDGKEGIDY